MTSPSSNRSSSVAAVAANDDAEREVRIVSQRMSPATQSKKRAYFELHGTDSEIATILLIGGPYRGMRIREDIDARGLYPVNGAHGEFVYRLLRRLDCGALAVPFDASETEIQRCLFKFDLPSVDTATLTMLQRPRIRARVADVAQQYLQQSA